MKLSPLLLIPEGVDDVGNVRRGALFINYLYHIIAVGDVFRQHSAPAKCALSDEFTFTGVYGAAATAESCAGTGFYLYEDQRIAVAAYDVQLTATGRPPITAQDFTTALS